MTNGMVHPSGVVHMEEFKVLVKPDDVVTKTAGGIYVPETAQRPMEVQTGTLEMVADDAFTYHVKDGCRHAKVGDRVLMARHAGVELNEKFTSDGKAYRIINDRDILCVIRF